MDEGSLAEEIEVLEAIYVEELDVQRNEIDEVTKIILQLHPATGDDLDQRFVCMTLILDLSPEYPNVPPDISIKNPRGIAEEELLSLREDMHKLCEDRKGGPVLFELIELAKDSLTAGNIPHCPCMICLEHFTEGENFTKTECYHYFHESCLSRYVTHMLTKTPEIVPAHAEPSPDANKLVCPVCREEIHYKVEDFDTLVEDEKFIFTPTAELQELQAKMAAILERQKANGGIIDIEAERNKYLVKNDDVVLLALPKVQNTGQNDRPRSRNSRKEKETAESLTESMDSFRDKEGDRYEGEQRPKSDYMKGKGRGIKFNNSNDDRRREKRWREEKRERTRDVNDANDSGHDSRDRTKREYESSGDRRHWRDENRNYKNRNFKGVQAKHGKKQVSTANDDVKETAKVNTDRGEDLTDKQGAENKTGTENKDEITEDKVSVQDSKDTATEEEECSDNQQAFDKNAKGNRGGFARPYEKRNEKEDNPRQNVQNNRRGGFGRPERNIYRHENYNDNRRNRGGFGKPGKSAKEASNEVPAQGDVQKNCQNDKRNASESLEDSPATADNDELENKTLDETKNISDNNRGQSNSAKGNRGGFGRPEQNRYKDETYTDKRSKRSGFGKPGNSSKESSNVVSSQDYFGKNGQNDKRYASDVLEKGPAIADTTELENKTLDDTKNKSEHKRGQSNYCAKGNRGGFGRPSERRGDYKDKSYNDVRSTTEYSHQQRGDFRRHEKKFYDDEHYRDNRTRQNRGGFGKPKKDYRMDKSRPSSSETPRQRVSESDTCSPRTVDQPKDESRNDRAETDRYSRDNRYSGRRRFEDRKYSEEGKSSKDARTGMNDRKSEYDKKERGYGDRYGNRNSRNYHDSHVKGKNVNQSESPNKEFHHDTDSNAERNKDVREDVGFSRIDESEGKFGKKLKNKGKHFESKNESNFDSQNEETDAYSNSTVNKFDQMSISDDSCKIQHSSNDSSVNERSSICDSKSGENTVNNSSVESKVDSERSVRNEGPPGFTVSPPPGFQRTAKDFTQVVQSPPGFSQQLK